MKLVCCEVGFSNNVMSTDRLQAFQALWKVAHEGEGVYSLSKAWDFHKTTHEAILLAQLFQWASFLLVVLEKLLLIL